MKTFKEWFVIEVPKEISLNGATHIKDLCLDAFRKKHLNIALDLHKTEFINSTALGALVRWHQRFSAAGGEIVLLNPSDEIQNLIEIVALDKLFTIFQNSQQMKMSG